MKPTGMIVFMAVLACMAVLIPNASAALSTTVSQSGADSDEVMKDSTFIIEASGWTGSCSQATISFAGCPSCSLSGEELTKSIGGGATSISWTTAIASNTASTQTVSVSVSSGCTLQQDTSSNFDIVLPPSISLSASTSSSSVAAGGTFSTNLNVVNSGETTANSVSITVSSPFSASCSSISSIGEGQSAAESCTVTAPSTLGTKTATFTASSSNAGSDSDSLTITVTGGSGDDTPGGSGSPSSGTGVTSTDISQVITIGAISAGEAGQALFTTAGLDLTEVLITPNADVSNVVVSTTQSATMPDTVTAPTGTIYGYLTVTALNVENENITTATMNFRVNSTWMASNGISQDDIILRRFNNNAWEDLETSVDNSDSDYVYFSATTTGFSVFVITTVTAATPDGGDDQAPTTICTPEERRCPGSELQQCSADGTAWEKVETCQYGCDSAAVACRTEPADTGNGAAEPTAGEFPWALMIGIIIVIIVIVVAVFVMKKRSSS